MDGGKTLGQEGKHMLETAVSLTSDVRFCRVEE